MKKVLSLVLAFVLVLGMIPTFAADAATGAQNLYDNGFITGKDGATVDAKLDVNAKLTRAELAALIAELNGAKEEAAAFAQPADFTDAAKFQDWAKPYIAYAQENQWMGGFPDGSFGPTKEVPAQQLAAVLMNALGYTVDTPEKYATVLTDAATLGIVVDGTALTRGEAFEAMWVAVKDVPMNTEEGLTLGVYLGKLEPEVPVVTEFSVKEVVADNLKTVLVEFNQPVDKDTLTSTQVKLVKGTTNVVATDGRILLEDGKTLAIVMTDRSQSDKLTLTIDGVKNTDGEAVVKYEQEILVNDVTIPNLEGVRALNPKQLELSFSEPVQMSETLFKMWSNVKIDETSVIAKSAVDYSKNTVILTLSSALAEGTHKIEVKEIKDFANFMAASKVFDFTIVKDAAAPVAVSATVKSKQTVVVTFDEPVDVTGSFKVDGSSTGLTYDWNAQKTEVTVGGLNLGISAVVEVKVEYKGQKDIMGNEVKDWTSIVTKVSDDATLPTVELTSVGAGNKLTFTFSKMMATNVVDAKLQILDKNSKVVQEIPVTTFKNSDNKILEVTPSILQGINAANYSAKLIGLKDATIRGNALPTTTLAFEAKDTLAPTVQPNYLVTAGTTGTPVTDNDTITIYFSEAMDVTSIETLANYFVNLAPLSTNSNATAIKAASDGKSVTITYKNAYSLKPTVTVYAVKDLAGNISTAVGTPVINQNNTVLNYTSAIALSNNTIEVTFTKPIGSVDPSLFFLQEKTGTSPAVVNFVSATVKSSDSTIVVFKTATDINSDLSVYNLQVGIPAAIKNIYGSTLTKNVLGTETAYAANEVITANVTDAVAPVFSSISAKDADGNALATNQFRIVFSEPVKATNADTFLGDMLIKDADGAVIMNGIGTKATVVGDLAAGTKTVVVTVTDPALLGLMKQGGANGEKTIKVSFPVATNITDKVGNKLEPVADQEVKLIVGTNPVSTITSATYTAATNTLVLTGTGFEGTFDATKITYTTDTPATKVLTGGTVTVTNATTVTIVLSDADATAIEALGGYGGANDVLNVAANYLTNSVNLLGGTANATVAVTIN